MRYLSKIKRSHQGRIPDNIDSGINGLPLVSQMQLS